uniref:ubiquitinyl hydrolase 1 n=1 Tax=Parastrongyloides trichosuri TaxID=131310 RepID=A0A0N4Z0Z5_PARTI
MSSENQTPTTDNDVNNQVNESTKTLQEQLEENEHLLYEQSRIFSLQIEDEVRNNQDLIGPKSDITTLVQAYAPETSPEYSKKALQLSNIYTNVRRVRGDGNCFYRSILTALLEKCLNDDNLLLQFQNLSREWRDKFFAMGFPELTTSDFCDSIDELLKNIADKKYDNNSLMVTLGDENIANYYVAYMRILTSAFLKENKALYEGFIEGGRTMDQFCLDEVEPMWKECDHISIIALVNALKVNIRIEYMDQSHSPEGGIHYDICGTDGEPFLFFLYRPGHYDILYKS